VIADSESNLHSNSHHRAGRSDRRVDEARMQGERKSERYFGHLHPRRDVRRISLVSSGRLPCPSPPSDPIAHSGCCISEPTRRQVKGLKG